MQPKSPKLLEEIRDASAFILQVTKGKDQNDFESDRLLRQADWRKQGDQRRQRQDRAGLCAEQLDSGYTVRQWQVAFSGGWHALRYSEGRGEASDLALAAGAAGEYPGLHANC
jgi:hypothetical protein